jgi:hypothetical protein
VTGAGVQACREAWRELQPGSGGESLRVEFELVPGDGGAAVRPRFLNDGGLGQAALEGCVLSALADLDLEAGAAPRSVRVTYRDAAGDGG